MTVKFQEHDGTRVETATRQAPHLQFATWASASAEARVLPGQVVDIIVRMDDTSSSRALPLIERTVALFDAVAFRPERIVIERNAGRWSVCDILVGNRSQFVQRGPIPGDMFAPEVEDSFFAMETIQTAMEFTLVMRYDGANPEGESFECTVTGTAARPAR